MEKEKLDAYLLDDSETEDFETQRVFNVRTEQGSPCFIREIFLRMDQGIFYKLAGYRSQIIVFPHSNLEKFMEEQFTSTSF